MRCGDRQINLSGAPFLRAWMNAHRTCRLIALNLSWSVRDMWPNAPPRAVALAIDRSVSPAQFDNRIRRLWLADNPANPC
jgi:hypothetical protein